MYIFLIFILSFTLRVVCKYGKYVFTHSCEESFPSFFLSFFGPALHLSMFELDSRICNATE